MANLDHILSEIRDLSQADLQELKYYLQASVPESKTQAADHSAPVSAQTADEFDADLDSVTFKAPPLPESFSRADIYDGHD